MKIKYCDKRMLDVINKRAIENNYNRALEQEFVDGLPDLKFPVTFCMLHEHAAGKPVAAHVRCRIMTAESLAGPFNSVFVDVEMGMFKMLPEVDDPSATSGPVGPEFSAN